MSIKKRHHKVDVKFTDKDLNFVRITDHIFKENQCLYIETHDPKEDMVTLNLDQVEELRNILTKFLDKNKES